MTLMEGGKSKPCILSALATYWPGHEATGPVQSLRAFAAGMQNDFEIRIIASDRTGLEPRGWHSRDSVLYAQLQKGWCGARGLMSLLRETRYDLLMLNSFHDPQFVIPILIWRKLGLIPRKPTILSPRGEFAQGALSLKVHKKRLYRFGVRMTDLTRDIWLHATADHEQRDIEATGLPCRGILRAPNVSLLPDLPEVLPSQNSGSLRVAFLGRVSPVKNIEFALDVLAQVTLPVMFEIYGPLVDLDYWQRLQSRIEQLPGHIKVISHGALPHDRVLDTMAAHDLFFLPTLGENFGHAIHEALSAGCPILIADTTPWRGLEEKGAGWDLPLSAPNRFVEAIQKMAQSDVEQRQQMRNAARRFAEDCFAESNAIEANRQMLYKALSQPCWKP